MKSKLALLAALLLAAVSSSATMTSNYSSYDSVTVVPNPGGSMTRMVLLEGNTNWNGSPPAQHTGHVSLTYGGVNHGSYEGPYNPNFNLNLNAQVTLQLSDPCFTSDGGCPISVDEGWVTCTVAGTFYFANGQSSGNTDATAISTLSLPSTGGYTCSQTYNKCGNTPGCGYGSLYAENPLTAYCDQGKTPDWYPNSLLDCATNGSGQPPSGTWGFATSTTCTYNPSTHAAISCYYVLTAPYNGAVYTNRLATPGDPIQPGSCTVNGIVY